MTCRTIVTILFLTTGSLASAGVVNERGGYIGGAFGVTSYEDDDQYFGSRFDDSDSSFQIYGGYKFLRYFALEGRLLNLGSYSVGSTDIDVSALTVNAVGIVPFGQSGWEFFGQLGLGAVSVDISGLGDDTAGTGSAGLGFRFTPIQHFSMALQIDAYAWEEEGAFGRTYDVGVVASQIAFQYNF